MKKLLLTLLFLSLAVSGWAAFPTTGILDTFDRANEGPPPTGWTDATGDAGLVVVSNRLTGSVANAHNVAKWNGSFGNDQEGYADIISPPSINTEYCQIFVRSAGDGDNGSGYVGRFYFDGTGVYGQLFWSDAVGAFTQIGSDSSYLSMATYTKFGISAIGSAIKLLGYNSGTTVWDTILSATDSNVSTGAYICVDLRTRATANSMVLDNFGGGTVTEFVGSGPRLRGRRSSFWGFLLGLLGVL